MLVPIIAGSDKTTVTAGTGQVDYWPIYGSIGNIHNNIRRAHGDGLILIGFLAIPKSKLRKILVNITHIICSQQGTRRVSRLSSILSAVISCVVSHYIQFPQTRNDEARGCVMPWWSLPSHHLGTPDLTSQTTLNRCFFLVSCRVGAQSRLSFHVISITAYISAKMPSAIRKTWQQWRHIWSTFTGSHRFPLYKVRNGIIVW